MYTQAHTYARSRTCTDVPACPGKDIDVNPVPLCQVHAQYTYGSTWCLHVLSISFNETKSVTKSR